MGGGKEDQATTYQVLPTTNNLDTGASSHPFGRDTPNTQTVLPEDDTFD